MSLQLRSLCCWLCSLILSLCLFAMPADAQVLPGIPTTTYNGATIPDFNATSFNDLPPIQQGGVLQVPPATANQIGYDPSRQWQAGATVGDVMQLGDFQDTFGLHQLTMRAISQLTGLPLETFTLDNFPLLKQQSLSRLVQAIPGLKNLPLGQVAPLADLVKGSGLGDMSNLMNAPLGGIAANPSFGNLSLDNLQLGQYSFTQIPGLSDVNIGSLDGWQTLPVNGVPGLGDVPFGDFPTNPFSFLGLIAIHDVTYGGDHAHKESRSTPTKFSISGSDQVGFHYPCAQSKGCDYLELNSPISLGIAGDPTGLHGARWIRGGTGPGEQMVKGGHGILGVINGGKEPTGRLPFGDVFKVVLTDTNESAGTGQFSLYFRVCYKNGFIDLGCTPYFIGPIPFLGTKEKGLVFVGETPGTPPDGIQQPPVPPEVQQLIDQYKQQAQPTNDSNATLCGNGPGGVDWKALATSITNIESAGSGTYTAVGTRDCDRQGCYIALGRYQLESFRSDTTSAISRQPGGGAFLQSIQAGHIPTQAEVAQYFPPAVQDQVFQSSMTGSINSLQRQGITGNAMIECLGEIWYHGSCDHGSTHDSNANSPTTLQYGQETLSGYNKALQANGATPCPTATPGGGTSTPTAGNGQSGQLMSNYINPDPGCTITSGYGPRIDPWGANEYHPGVDCSTGRNSPILSANGGKVIAVETGCPPNLTGANDHCGQGYGNYVVVAQPNGYQIMYSHLGQVNVQLGQTVAQSQQLGLEGTSGRSTGNHLLFEVDKVNPGVDPYTPWLKPGQYQTVNPSSLGIPLGR